VRQDHCSTDRNSRFTTEVAHRAGSAAGLQGKRDEERDNKGAVAERASAGRHVGLDVSEAGSKKGYTTSSAILQREGRKDQDGRRT
jgi:hypothetical protein